MTHAPLIRKVDCLQLPVADLEAGARSTSVWDTR